MCASREDMEGVLKVKINTLIDQLETNHQHQDVLKTQINANNKQTHAEEKSVIDLHAKLRALEETLRVKELDNERLREKVRQQQIKAECVDEYKERTEVSDIHENFKAKQLKEDYGDLLISNKSLKSKAKETLSEITKAEKLHKDEEQLCDAEEERVKCLEKENADVAKRLESMLRLQQEIRERENAQKEKLKALRAVHSESEGRANKLEAEVKRMESQLESMTERLSGMKNEQDTLVCRMLEEKMRIDESIENHRVNREKDSNGPHKAMKLRQRNNWNDEIYVPVKRVFILFIFFEKKQFENEEQDYRVKKKQNAA